MRTLIAAFLVAGMAFAQDVGKTAKLGKTVPNFTCESVDGKESFSLEHFRRTDEDEGKIVVVTFWSFKCPAGKRALGELKKISTYCEKNDVVFIGICSYGESSKALAKYQEENDIAYPLYYDGDCELADLFRAKVVTQSYIIDRDGKLVYNGAYKGRRRQPALMAALKQVVAGESVSVSETRARG